MKLFCEKKYFDSSIYVYEMFRFIVDEIFNNGVGGDGLITYLDFVEKVEQDLDKFRRTFFVSNLDYFIDEDRIGQIFVKVENRINNKIKNSLFLFIIIYMYGVKLYFDENLRIIQDF